MILKTKKIVALGFAIAFVGMATGCYKHSFTAGTGGNVNGEAAYSKWHSHWLFGIIGETDVKLKEICPSGNATIKDEHSFVNGLIGAVIGFIWYPTTVEVYCGEGKAASIQLSPEQMRAIAALPETLDFARTVAPVKAAELEDALRTYQNSTKNVAAAPGVGSHL